MNTNERMGSSDDGDIRMEMLPGEENTHQHTNYVKIGEYAIEGQTGDVRSLRRV